MTAILDRPSTSPPADDAAPPAHRRSRRAVPWSKLSLAGLLTATGFLYLWNLSASGYANTFYAAAAWAGSAKTTWLSTSATQRKSPSSKDARALATTAPAPPM